MASAAAAETSPHPECLHPVGAHTAGVQDGQERCRARGAVRETRHRQRCPATASRRRPPPHGHSDSWSRTVLALACGWPGVEPRQPLGVLFQHVAASSARVIAQRASTAAGVEAHTWPTLPRAPCLGHAHRRHEGQRDVQRPALSFVWEIATRSRATTSTSRSGEPGQPRRHSHGSTGGPGSTTCAVSVSGRLVTSSGPGLSTGHGFLGPGIPEPTGLTAR